MTPRHRSGPEPSERRCLPPGVLGVVPAARIGGAPHGRRRPSAERANFGRPSGRIAGTSPGGGGIPPGEARLRTRPPARSGTSRGGDVRSVAPVQPCPGPRNACPAAPYSNPNRSRPSGNTETPIVSQAVRRRSDSDPAGQGSMTPTATGSPCAASVCGRSPRLLKGPPVHRRFPQGDTFDREIQIAAFVGNDRSGRPARSLSSPIPLPLMARKPPAADGGTLVARPAIGEDRPPPMGRATKGEEPCSRTRWAG